MPGGGGVRLPARTFSTGLNQRGKVSTPLFRRNPRRRVHSHRGDAAALVPIDPSDGVFLSGPCRSIGIFRFACTVRWDRQRSATGYRGTGASTVTDVSYACTN